MYSFFAMMARMKNIERWALMRNSIQENISEHSLEVAMLAHGLSLIANEKCGKHVDSNEIALMGDRKSTRLNSSHITPSRMPSSA